MQGANILFTTIHSPHYCYLCATANRVIVPITIREESPDSIEQHTG